MARGSSLTNRIINFSGFEHEALLALVACKKTMSPSVELPKWDHWEASNEAKGEPLPPKT